jgi:hypothetical protein
VQWEDAKSKDTYMVQARRPFALLLIDADAEGFLVRRVELLSERSVLTI